MPPSPFPVPVKSLNKEDETENRQDDGLGPRAGRRTRTVGAARSGSIPAAAPFPETRGAASRPQARDPEEELRVATQETAEQHSRTSRGPVGAATPLPRFRHRSGAAIARTGPSHGKMIQFKRGPKPATAEDWVQRGAGLTDRWAPDHEGLPRQ